MEPPVEVTLCVTGQRDPVVGALNGVGRVEEPAEEAAACGDAFGGVHQLTDQAEQVPLPHFPGAANRPESRDNALHLARGQGNGEVGGI